VSDSIKYAIFLIFTTNDWTYEHSKGVFLKSKMDWGKSILDVCFGIWGT